jgi:murein DD-endopeptidase MepM/ murein hydrolase activator NlpD
VQIIVVHPRLKQARTMTVRKRWVLAAIAGLMSVVLVSTGVLSYIAIHNAFQAKVPFVQQWVAAAAAKDVASRDVFVRQNIDALAVKLGQLQAQVARIDAISERVSKMAGVKPADLPKTPGRGGPLIGEVRPFSLGELSNAVDLVSKGLENRVDSLNLIESELIYQTVTTKLLPTNQPLQDGFMGSRYGSRIDPFTGRSAMHEGIDFNAPSGTPILAAGAGVVIFAGFNTSYGNQVDVDHGGGVVTRYAHASKLLVKEGEIVKQGQKIAEVGSTGRSTGAHLHFEVRVSDEAQDPLKYLQSGLNFKGTIAASNERSRRQ